MTGALLLEIADVIEPVDCVGMCVRDEQRVEIANAVARQQPHALLPHRFAGVHLRKDSRSMRISRGQITRQGPTVSTRAAAGAAPTDAWDLATDHDVARAPVGMPEAHQDRHVAAPIARTSPHSIVAHPADGQALVGAHDAADARDARRDPAPEEEHVEAPCWARCRHLGRSRT
jgi:hypothetical protein